LESLDCVVDEDRSPKEILRIFDPSHFVEREFEDLKKTKENRHETVKSGVTLGVGPIRSVAYDDDGESCWYR